MLRVAVLALLILPASALAQWESAAVAPAGRAPAVVVADDGRALLSFTHGAGTRLASWRPGGTPLPAGRLAGQLLGTPLRVGAGRVLLPLVSGPPARQRLSVAGVSVDGRVVQKPRRIRPYRFAYAAGSAVAPGGEAAIAWVEQHGKFPRNRLRLRLAVRSPGGGFSRARVVTNLGEDEHPGPAAVGVAYSGRRLVLAYTTQAGGRRRVHALIGRPGRFRRQVLGPHRGIADIAAASNARGRVVVAWQTQDGGEEGNQPAEVRSALLERGAGRFSRTRLLDPGEGAGRWPGEIGAAMAADGTAALTWSQMAGGNAFPVVVATAPPGGRFGPLQTLDANGAAGDVAFAPDGRLLATWARITRGNYQQPDQVLAAQRDPGALSFGPAEPVSGDDGASPPAAAVDPASGRFVVAWALMPPYPSRDPARPFVATRAR